jgi:hypothetical protein
MYICTEQKYIANTGAIPTIVSYNASDVKIYNATSSLLRFEKQFFSSTLKKRSSILHTMLAL